MAQNATSTDKGILLEDLTWREAEQVILKLTDTVEAETKQEKGGTHADEIETSMMLFIAPASVDMSKAVKDYHPSAKGGLTRNPEGECSYSASGIYGDATLATRQKGEIMVRAIVDGILNEIQDFQSGN